MSTAEAVEGIAALAVGGFIFIVFGTALADTALQQGGILLNFRFWGVLYVLAALVLGVGFVVGIIAKAMGGGTRR